MLDPRRPAVDHPLVGFFAGTGRIAFAQSYLGAAAEANSGTTPAPVSLATGASAVASLSAVNIDPGADRSVTPALSTTAITPPHATVALMVPMADFPACSSGTPWMTVEPLTSG